MKRVLILFFLEIYVVLQLLKYKKKSGRHLFNGIVCCDDFHKMTVGWLICFIDIFIYGTVIQAKLLQI